MRVLIVAPNWIGDAVMSLSLLQALHADEALRFADGRPCELHVLAPSVTAPVYQFSPVVHTVQAEPFAHGELQWGLRKQVGRALQAKEYGLAITLPNSLKSALVPWFAKVPQRVGYDGELRSLILNRALPKPKKDNKPPMIEWYGRLGGYDRALLANPLMQVSTATTDRVCVDFQLQRGFLAIAPGAEYGPAKRWPARHFAAVVQAFLERNPSQRAVLLGGPKDVEFSETIHSLVPEPLRARLLVLAGKTSLPQAIALMAGASQLVTNDSGLMHVAAALDVQVHAVFGSSSPSHTPPLNPSARVYYLALPCSPCYQRECPLGHLDCLNKLEPELVATQLKPVSGGG
ncbi:lipopolysaccharide heptosyltransferase II [Limnobacter humi]|uniref:lipopolysaccharide heptosyltransferase II n=1 Tax=Limnobacter humi TaxID=1778671 RepID=A0ABT1WCE8_9BURK|nr:lipopolysaccharide heptosyltransferase II [Limnobacter humi]MCQ8895180.1 lipopolysaccharide heptosyltransferase II [Limnobacter humi]